MVQKYTFILNWTISDVFCEAISNFCEFILEFWKLFQKIHQKLIVIR